MIEFDGVVMTIRDGEPGDVASVVCTWVDSYRDRSMVERVVYEREQRALANRMAVTATIKVLCDAVVSRTIYAWACSLGEVLHYVYVVPELRERGAAQLLLGHMNLWRDTVECSHRWTKPNRRFLWNPYTVGVGT